jgi:hypothetical protein
MAKYVKRSCAHYQRTDNLSPEEVQEVCGEQVTESEAEAIAAGLFQYCLAVYQLCQSGAGLPGEVRFIPSFIHPQKNAA